MRAFEQLYIILGNKSPAYCITRCKQKITCYHSCHAVLVAPSTWVGKWTLSSCCCAPGHCARCGSSLHRCGSSLHRCTGAALPCTDAKVRLFLAQMHRCDSSLHRCSSSLHRWQEAQNPIVLQPPLISFCA